MSDDRFEVVDLGLAAKSFVTAVVAQVKLRADDFGQADGLSYIKNVDHVRRKISALLRNVEPYAPDLIAFPELAIPEEMLALLRDYSGDHHTIIVGGSHYVIADGGRIAVCPVFIDGDRYDVHKLNPSPFQVSMVDGDSLCGGSTNSIFKNTRAGNFAVLLCSDFLHDDLLGFVNTHALDFLIVPSCQDDSDRYFTRFAEQVRDSKEGLYALFPNLYVPEVSEGRSGIIGVVDDIFVKSAISRRITDAKPRTKLWEAGSGNDFVVADFDLRQKKPPRVKNKAAAPNVIIKRTRSYLGKTADGPPYKLIAFDLDGTIIRGAKFSWVKLWEEAGDTSGDRWREFLCAYRAGEISYDKWCSDAVSQFQAAGITKERIEEVARRCMLTTNFRDGMARIRALGLPCGIISGGVAVFLEVLIPDHSELFEFVYINDLTFRSNGQLAGVVPTRYDFEGKYEALELECDERGISVSESIFVGDQLNDDEILRRAGHSIIYSESADSVGLSAHKTITTDDFTALAEYIERVVRRKR